MAQELALRHVRATEAILTAQHARIANPDRKARFAFVMPALSPDAPTRDAFFAGLARVENREHERWVVRRRCDSSIIRCAARTPSATSSPASSCCGDSADRRYLLSARLDRRRRSSGHNSPAAARLVTAFLAAQKDYPPRLRQVIEQHADQLIRARAFSASEAVAGAARMRHRPMRAALTEWRHGIDVDRHAAAQLGLCGKRRQHGLAHARAMAALQKDLRTILSAQLRDRRGRRPEHAESAGVGAAAQVLRERGRIASAARASRPFTTMFTSAVSGG